MQSMQYYIEAGSIFEPGSYNYSDRKGIGIDSCEHFLPCCFVAYMKKTIIATIELNAQGRLSIAACPIFIYCLGG